MRRIPLALALLAGCASAGRTAEMKPADDEAQDYLVFVASEGNDRIALVRFGQGKAKVEREHRIGVNPTELAGPHGLSVSPDGAW